MSDQLAPRSKIIAAPYDCLTRIFSFAPTATQAVTVRAMAKVEDEDCMVLAKAPTARKLASHVARGEQRAAAAMLTLNPELALERTEVIGYIELPAFIDTAVKCAAWARDHEML